jgi:hypothetical protein
MDDRIGSAFLFLAVVALVIVVGVVVGMIVASRIDRLMTPRQSGAPDETSDPPQREPKHREPHQEDQP